MYSNPRLRWLLIPLLVVGLWPVVNLLFAAAVGDQSIAMMANILLWKVAGGCFIALLLTNALLKIFTQTLSPVWLTVLGVLSIFLSAWVVSSVFLVFWFIPMFALGWLLSCWLLELAALQGAYVGVVFVISLLVGSLFGLAAN